MNRKKIITILACLCALSVSAFALEYSADVSMTSKMAGTMTGKVYVKDTKIRMEIGPVITITRPDLGVAWAIMPGQGIYMEQPMDIQSLAATGSESGAYEVQPLGQETIKGKVCDKKRMIFKNNGKELSILQWSAPGSMLPLRVAAEDGMFVQEYSNVSEGSQADSLFELPRGYQKMQMPDMSGMSASGMPDISAFGSGKGMPTVDPAMLEKMGLPAGMISGGSEQE